MQRFKKFTMALGNVDAYGQPVVFGRRYGYSLAHEAAGKFGKFVYGANATLTQAARYRASAFVYMARYPGETLTQAIEMKGNISELLFYSRAGGCRLP